MFYELWTVSSFGPGEPLMPLTREAMAESFSSIYDKFTKLNKTTPCVIVLNDSKSKEKIYESPDGGKTVYERNFGDYDNRTKIKGS
tara:strand:+ start:11711 stop:11968 length:258 start_codon:yes stop_codon:yes gene_type:complete